MKTRRPFLLKPFQRPSTLYDIRKIFKPQWFQGNREDKKYFEGWYFKNVSLDGKDSWSFIPGVSLNHRDSHSFVQAINGQTGETFYFRFPADQFAFSDDKFEVWVGKNYFSSEKFYLELKDGNVSFNAEVLFDDINEFPVSISRPGIMGWYRYMPFMECYHGVVSLDHGLRGYIKHNDRQIDFTGGRGYIEKDWGSSMPKAWIWMQSNHFENTGTSFMLSVARIPWIGSTFTGFLGFFLHDNQLISFATYTGAEISELTYTDSEVHITITGHKYLIHIHGVKAEHHDENRPKGGLKAPVLGNMDRIIHESIDAEIHVSISDKDGNPVFNGSGLHSGLEFVGDLELLKL